MTLRTHTCQARTRRSSHPHDGHKGRPRGRASTHGMAQAQQVQRIDGRGELAAGLPTDREGCTHTHTSQSFTSNAASCRPNMRKPAVGGHAAVAHDGPHWQRRSHYKRLRGSGLSMGPAQAQRWRSGAERSLTETTMGKVASVKVREQIATRRAARDRTGWYRTGWSPHPLSLCCRLMGLGTQGDWDSLTQRISRR